jgi:hypothetical protein
VRGGLGDGGTAERTAPTHVVVLRTLESPGGGLHLRRREQPEAWLSRVTVVEVAAPFPPEQAAAWLEGAGEPDLAQGMAVLNRTLAAYRIAAGDPELRELDRRQALAARVGYGAGEEVADGRWTAARELPWRPPARRRRRMLAPEGRLAGILTGQQLPLVSEELALRTRSDLDAGRNRHAALQLVIALDTAIAELSAEPTALDLSDRLGELRGYREAVGEAAQAALSGELEEAQLETVTAALGRVEAALRARAAA